MNGNFIQQSESNALIDPLDEKLIAIFPGRVVRKRGTPMKLCVSFVFHLWYGLSHDTTSSH